MDGQTYHSIADLRESMGLPRELEQKGARNTMEKKIPELRGESASHAVIAEKIMMHQSADYVGIAEKVILHLRRVDKYNPNKYNFGKLTTSKIRNLLSFVDNLYNKIIIDNNNDEKLSDDIVDQIRYMKLRFAYEAGRENDVKYFCDKAELIDAIDLIGNSRKRFIRFAKYMESLVAYHKFYGGKEY